MINKNIRESLHEMGFDNSLLFDNPSFDNSIIGYTDDGRVVYDFNKMASEYAEETGCELIEAIEFIEYNTMRALPYADQTVAPIIIFPFDS